MVIGNVWAFLAPPKGRDTASRTLMRLGSRFPATSQLLVPGVAVLLWGSRPRILIVSSQILADTYRKQFNVNWRNARRPA
jgi:hypothetical protein